MVRLVVLLLLAFPSVARADSLALILNGIPGTPEHETRFNEWTDQTRSALVDRLGFADENVVVLNRPNAEEIRAAFASIRERAESEDVFYLFFIGHGSYSGEYKFNIAREDLTGSDYSELIDSLPTGRAVVVNGTNSSGGSIEALAAQNRVIVTATRTGTERNDTIFYDYFLEALTDSTSDEDLNGRLSVWEAFRYAALGVERSFEERNQLATEHPQISDNGGEMAGTEPEEPLVLAQLTHFNTSSETEVADPVLRALLEERNQIEAAIANLRADRDALPTAIYEDELEELLVELALKNQAIRAQEGDQ